jgi:tetratricopeptide (TPR) repeat protein
MEDVFAIQDEISTAITDKLRVRLLEDERPRAVKRHTDNIEAYHLYMRGRYCALRDRYPDAIAYYEQALAVDQGYPLPYVGIADVLSLLSYYGYLAPNDAFPRAKAASKRAIEIDDSIGEAYSALGFIGVMYDYAWDEAKRLLERGRELNPNHENARLWYVTYLWAMGLTESAKQEVRLTLESNPVSLLANLYMGYAFQWARQCDEAAAEFRKLMEMDPDYLMARVWLGHTYIVAGKYDDAVATLEPAAAATEDSTYNWGSLGWAYGLAGRRRDALEVLARLEDMSKHRYVRYTHRGFVYLGLREYDQAIALLEKGREEREADLAFLSTPLLDPCRSHPKFIELVRKMGLEDRGILDPAIGGPST